MSSTQRTPPPGKSTSLLKPNIGQESDTASDYVVSEPDCGGGQHNVTRRYKRKHDDSSSTLCEIKDILAELQLQQKTQASKFEAEINKMIQQNTEIKESIQHMSDKYDDILSQLQQTKTENAAYKNRIKTLELKVELIERNSKATCLELRNVPENPQENKSSLTDMMKNIGDVLNVQVLDSDVRNIFRPKISQNKISPIIVEFSTTSLKENIIKSSKTYNKSNTTKLNTSHLKLKGEPKPIFVSESLTTYGRRLYYLARESVKNNKYAGCWTSYGKVYMRQKEGDPATLISCEEDLTNSKTK